MRLHDDSCASCSVFWMLHRRVLIRFLHWSTLACQASLGPDSAKVRGKEVLKESLYSRCIIPSISRIRSSCIESFSLVASRRRLESASESAGSRAACWPRLSHDKLTQWSTAIYRQSLVEHWAIQCTNCTSKLLNSSHQHSRHSL